MSRPRRSLPSGGHALAPLPTGDRMSANAATAAAGRGVVSAMLAAAAGLGLCAAVAILVWVMSPGSGLTVGAAGSAAAAGYVLGHFGDVTIGSATLTITPLLLPMVFGVLLAAGAGRAGRTVSSARDELIAIAAGTAAYGALVGLVTFVLAPAGAHDGMAILGALVLSAVALSAGTLIRRGGLRAAVEQWPQRVRVAVAGGAMATATLLAAAGLLVAVALIRAFAMVAELTDTLTTGVGPGVGLTVVGVLYVPNAVLTGLGYLTGIGYRIGAGEYSPFGSVLADLPPFPLLAAVPQSAAASTVGLVTLAAPVLAGVLVGRVVLVRLATLTDRLQAVAGAAGVAGALTAVLVGLARGGVSGGAWADSGAVGWRVGLVVAAAVALVAAVWVVAAGGRHRSAASSDTAGRSSADARPAVTADSAADRSAVTDGASGGAGDGAGDSAGDGAGEGAGDGAGDGATHGPADSAAGTDPDTAPTPGGRHARGAAEDPDEDVTDPAAAGAASTDRSSADDDLDAAAPDCAADTSAAADVLSHLDATHLHAAALDAAHLDAAHLDAAGLAAGRPDNDVPQAPDEAPVANDAAALNPDADDSVGGTAGLDAAAVESAGARLTQDAAERPVDRQF